MLADTLNRPYRVQYLSKAPAQLPENTLACVRFGRDLIPVDDPRVIDVGLGALGDIPAVELWQSQTPVSQGWQDGISYAENGSVLFGCLRLPESDLSAMEHTSFRTYVRIHRLLHNRGYPCWLRVWNFISGLTRGEGDQERYRQFSLGRYRALAVKPDFEFALPAATAIGMRDGGFVIYFLAGKTSGVQIENPRQVSAFRYPREYGPRSPSFSRALLKPWADRTELLVSGTASIVGHASLHIGDAISQLEECLRNVRALVQQATTEHFAGRAAAFSPETFKLYLRDPALMPVLRDQLATVLPAPALLLQGDICRQELLLEVEALYSLDTHA